MEGIANDMFTGLRERGYKVVSSIGRGGCGHCYLVHSEKYNEDFACKIIDTRSLQKNKAEFARKTYQFEIDALKKADHPNIVKIYEYFQVDDIEYIIEEYCKGGSVDKIIRRPRLTNELLKNIIVSIIDALNFLHKEGIAHHDIKPGNIFLDEYNRPILGDFGLSRVYAPGEMASHYDASMAYAAPELLQGKPYDPFRADVWAFGVSVYQLVTGRLPFGGSCLENVRKSVIAGVYETPIADQQIVTLINRCLTTCPEERPTFEDLALMFPKKIRLRSYSRPPKSTSFSSVPMLSSSMHRIKLTEIKLISKNSSVVLPPLRLKLEQ